MEQIKDNLEKLNKWALTALLAVISFVAIKTLDKIESIDNKIDVVKVTVQELNVKQEYNDETFKEFKERLNHIETRDHTQVMLKDRDLRIKL